jgi:hypothetical protein
MKGLLDDSRIVGRLNVPIKPEGYGHWIRRYQRIRDCQEKLLNVMLRSPYRKPTQVGRVEYSKVRERNLVKELGKLAP